MSPVSTYNRTGGTGKGGEHASALTDVAAAPALVPLPARATSPWIEQLEALEMYIVSGEKLLATHYLIGEFRSRGGARNRKYLLLRDVNVPTYDAHEWRYMHFEQFNTVDETWASTLWAGLFPKVQVEA